MKLLYIYSGLRKGRYQGDLGKDYPDTRFWGKNHMSAYGIDAETLEWTDIAPLWVRKIIGFRLQHLFMFFASRRYDVVFGPSLLYMMALHVVIPSKAKYVLFNTSLVRTLNVNKPRPWRYRILLLLIRKLDGIVCPSTSQKEWLEKEIPWLVGKVFYVPLGVDTGFYSPIFTPREKYVLSVGYDIGRDFDTLMRVAERLPRIPFKVVCHPLNVKHIKHIPSNVQLFHDTPFSELNDMYKTAGVSLITTQDDQPQFGSSCSGQTALLDAMAAGIPTIITRQACLKDYVSDNREVYLVEPYDDAQIAALIPTLFTPYASGIAERARTRVESFSTSRMAQELAAVLTKLVKE